MTRILFVCLGNICRSPTAEAVFRAKLKERQVEQRISCDSAGTSHYHVGEAPDGRAAQAALRRGYDMRELRARQVHENDFEHFDLILAMDRNNLAELQRRAGNDHRSKLRLFLEFADAGELDVPDPYYGGREGFDHVLDLVESACDGLLRQLLERSGS